MRVLVDSLGDKVRSILVPHFDEYSPDVNSDFIFAELRGTFSTVTLLQVLVGISTFEHTNWFGYWFLFKIFIPTGLGTGFSFKFAYQPVTVAFFLCEISLKFEK
jgi:hypothetical protein